MRNILEVKMVTVLNVITTKQAKLLDKFQTMIQLEANLKAILIKKQQTKKSLKMYLKKVTGGLPQAIF